MNLARHVSVLWRFRALVAAFLLLGIGLAFLAAFRFGPDGLERRGSETWQADTQILVTQPGFPWGRAVLPGVTNKPTDGTEAPKTGSGSDQQFADPGRFASLALLYSVLSLSDQVRDNLPEKPTAEQLTAQPYDLTGNGNTFLPIIKLGSLASTEAGAIALNEHATAGLQKLISGQQDDEKIDDSERVELKVIKKPEHATLISGRSTTPSILAFMLCGIIALAAAHILEALRPRPGAKQRDEDPPAPNGNGNGNGHGHLPDHRGPARVPAPPTASDWSRV